MFEQVTVKKSTYQKKARNTHCFNCKEKINSEQYDICQDCSGIVCGCGSCFCEWNGSYYE